ncbi:MAG: excinuclease ABC subunit UvrC [Planctomycetota bacterium]
MSVHPWSPSLAPAELPDRPGVYLFRDEAQKVLYVGKAARLRSRVASYRTPGGDGRVGVRFLQEQAKSVELIVTRTEGEALLLEDQLIKTHKPPHNIRLKDDKSFLMLRLDLDERFPRLKFVRAHNPAEGKPGGRSRTFGPFPSARAVRQTLADLHRIVPLRDCTDSVMNHRSRPCLRHQIGLCSAPCVGYVDENDYAGLVERAVDVLSGDIGALEDDLDGRMRTAAEKLEFEQAAMWRDRLKALRRTVERQGVTSAGLQARDVLALARRGGDALIHRLAFREGRLTESRTHRFRSELGDEELLHVVLTAIYGAGRRRPPNEVVVPLLPIDDALLANTLGTSFTVPTSGEKRRMLELAGENARAELVRQEASEERDAEVARQLARLVDLDTTDAPVIDGFDVSNLQGAHVVASRVRFRGGIADRAGYRRYRIKTVEGQDDFASMQEVVTRSLRRGLAEDDLPDLIVIDGGREQLSRALAARDEVGAWDVAVVSLAKARPERMLAGKRKQETEERVFVRPDAAPIELPRHSDVRHLFERIRDEAHRFAINFHRASRGRITSKLDSIPGVGPAKRKALLKRFGSVVGVAGASYEELLGIPGISRELAQVIREHLAEKPGA